MYYVYLHESPNGKVYIGQTNNLNKRWNEGKNYIACPDFYNDIDIYGWDNIKHYILKECGSREEAMTFEKLFTILLDSEKPEKGYNKTHYKDECLKLLNNKKIYDKNDYLFKEYSKNKRNIFEESGYTTDEARRIINERIFNETYRHILIRRYIDDIKYPQLTEEFSLTERHIKQICSESIDKIKEYL